jgi:uncharacterized protein (TIGR01244 family)
MWPFSFKSQSPHVRWMDDDFALSGQIDPNDVPKLAEAGFKTIVCARPDREDVDQPDFTMIAKAALKAGLKVVHIPVSSGIGEGQLIRMEAALRDLPRPMLGYCRSGARAGSLYSAAKRAMA